MTEPAGMPSIPQSRQQSEPARVAVVGGGYMGHNHIRVLREMAGVDLVGVADRDGARTAALSKQYGVRCYADHDELLDREHPEVVVVAVPTSAHVPVALDVVARGVHVLVEKPIAPTVEQAEQLVTAARDAGVTLGVGHVERFNPAVIELKRHLDRGMLGRVFMLHSRRLSPYPRRVMDVGVGADLGTHELDMMRYLTGSEIVTVNAGVSQVLHPLHEDIVFGLVRFATGALGILDVNWVTPTKVRDISITGERGMFTVNYLTQELFFYANASAPRQSVGSSWLLGHDFSVDEGDMTRLHIVKREPLLNELESFLAACRAGSRPVVSGEDGIAALRLAQQLVEVGRTAEQAAVSGVGATVSA